ncbi:MAG TPA: tRNA pseudouridine synthase A [Chitinophagales bacterium]|nr:tRNA pseudouridine synthase A [Chitinophagales bacterium]
MRYILHLSYDGTNYCGWQVQANSPSVQQTINQALQKLLGQHIKSMGCGRTDTGVHAKDFYMHFDSEREITDKKDFLFRLNCVLPEDITIFRIFDAADNANVRFDATERTYEYYVHFDKSSFIKRFSFYQGFYQIDWEKVLEATEFIKTIEDFTSLCLPSEDFKTNICYIKQAKWEILPSQHLILKPYDYPDTASPIGLPLQLQPGQMLRFTVTSNRFLRGMIRKIVGTVLMVGKGRISVDEFKDTVANKKDFRIHYLAPPNGLFLSKIRYPYID